MGRTSDGPGPRWPGFLLSLVIVGAPAVADTLGVPDVPYLPQTEAMCGGAALAMVLRYWGLPDIRPDDFKGSRTPEGTGIPSEELRRLAEALGFQAFTFTGTEPEVLSHLEKGRPLIALLSSTPGRYHYVVILAWANHRVLVHDPAVGPFRVLSEAEWQRRWSEAARFTLLLLPPPGFVHRAEASPGSPSDSGSCAALVQPGLDQALGGDLDAAKEHLAAAASWCPRSSLPMREMAALEFRQEHWAAAADLAAEAVRRDPSDHLGWKLLATSRFLAGQRPQALMAWNRIDEPRLDLVQIHGFARMPSRVVYEYLGEEPATMLTPTRLRLVQRRIEALPATQLARVTYRPLRGGMAQLDVNVVERPAVSSPRSVLIRSAVHALFERAIGADVFRLAPSGDSIRVFGQWRPNRSHGALAVSAPHFLGLPGIVTAEAIWDEQSYRLESGSSGDAPVRERRKRGAVSLAHWWTADTKATVSIAADDWKNRGRYLSSSGDLEQRLFGDRIALEGMAAGWWSGASSSFYAASARGAARTRTTPEGARVVADLAYEIASEGAPLALWSGAGTGYGRDALLRSHSLVSDGVIGGKGFGRELVHTSIQAEAPIASVGPARLRLAVFVDAAKVMAPSRGASLVDIGVGLRLQPPGRKSALRVDVATPWGSAAPHLSVGWQTEWP